MYTYYFLKPPLTAPPSYELPDPDLDSEWYGEVWVRYSQTSTRTPHLFGHNFRETAHPRLIQADISLELFGKLSDNGGPSYEQALVFKSRLDVWYHALPEPLSACRIVYPGHIYHQ
jgi:hypothetical protein